MEFAVSSIFISEHSKPKCFEFKLTVISTVYVHVCVCVCGGGRDEWVGESSTALNRPGENPIISDRSRQ